MNNISVDFSNILGKIKPLHGVCCAPYTISYGPNQYNIDKYFKQAHIPYCRLHDCCGTYGGAYFVDVPNIFRDFSADENDPASYDFHYTDEYIKAIQDTGCETYYRLGVTIEWGSKKYTSVVPADFDKWARICEHIIMHYNQGWADGFHYNLKYWEIWNEPENPGNVNGPSQWAGTKEEFYDLYKVASKYLKSKFPEILVGGYGSCGFYPITRDNVPKSFHSFLTFFTDFLEMAKKEDCPVDFFSWHIYTCDENEVYAHAKYVRETLDSYGFTNTESHLNEWNIGDEGHGFLRKHTMEGGSFNIAVMSLFQNCNYLDKAMYYCFSAKGGYNGFLDQNDSSIDAPWYTFVGFGELYDLGDNVKLENNGKRLYGIAAKNDEKGAIILSNYKSEDSEITLKISGIKDGSKITSELLKDKQGFLPAFEKTVNNGEEFKIILDQHQVMMLRITF
ncbi:MAG: hypothetical protein IJC89_05240 [Clostridia bacterium]|nr:hypothetical protein [Clostridia bacterium]